MVSVLGAIIVGTLVTPMMTAEAQQQKVTECHIPPGNPDNRHEITTGTLAVPAHVRNHGDGGSC